VHDEIDWHNGDVPVITFDLSEASATEGENPMEGRKIFLEDLRNQVRDNAKRLEVERRNLPMHAWNRIAVPRGIVEGQPPARSGASVRALLDHFREA